MELENHFIIDIESNGLLAEADRIHVMSASYQAGPNSWEVMSTSSYDKMKSLILDEEVTLIGHNLICYDIPVLEKVLGVKHKCKVIDTLGLSWAMYPWRKEHGLEKYGTEFGVPKPQVQDEEWKGVGKFAYAVLDYEDDIDVNFNLISPYLKLSKECQEKYCQEFKAARDSHLELMKYRCEEDVKINTNLFLKQLSELEFRFRDNLDRLESYISYCNFKMSILKMQQDNPIKIDVNILDKNIDFFEDLKQEKINALVPAMPKIKKTSLRKKPSQIYKKDGELSKKGEEWFNLLEAANLPDDYSGEITLVVGYEDPNPQSHVQVKDWLFSLGWEPEVYEDSKSTNPEKEGQKIPQIRVDGMLCESVLRLKEVEPAIEDLDGLSVITHRLGVLKSFKKNLVNGYVVAGASALTNTMRFRHRSPVVNLPGVMSSNKDESEGKERPLRDGRYVREVMIADEGYVFVGSDLNSLEDRSKQHYIYPYDPEYVESMMQEGFDPHLDLAVFAGALTEEQAAAHKKKEEDHGKIRHQYKQANYSCTYGVGGHTLSKSIGSSVSHAEFIIDAYWKKNWAVKKFADDQEVQVIDGRLFIKNPINGYWYFLPSEKDKFSTLNQGGATYIFDMWVYLLIQSGVKISLNYHDEYAGQVKIDQAEEVTIINKNCIQEVNSMLGLLREMDCDTKLGKSYADVH
jgi:hypothetical protein